MISLDKSGGRTIHLFIPFEHNGKKIEAITLAPARLGHLLRWSEGAWKTSIELLVELAGVDEAVIRDLRYPDADRVMESFMAILPETIRSDIVAGQIPLKLESEPYAAVEDAIKATNGGGEPVGPGVPIPAGFDQPGFDMSEEP